VPAGVINVIPSKSASAVTRPLLADPRLRKVSFTGSTQVGQTLLREAADNVLRTSMELGGCAPFIVFEDADLDVAVASALTAKTRSNGEACNAANTFYVHRSLAQEFSERLAAEFDRVKVGPGIEDGVGLGALVSRDQWNTVNDLVADALDRGAKMITHSRAPQGAGFFYPLTVLSQVPEDAKILTHEIFGPVAPVTVFDTEEEVVRRANGTPFGLAGYVQTKDIDRIARLSRTLQVGMISVNAGPTSNAAAPFGGVKASGMGREGSVEGIREYLEPIYIGLPDNR
jgi:succinate-semialdehyde dehydrogenase/glutarate-semialdehyde dehydrogenase